MKKRIIAWAVLLSVCAAALGLWCSAAVGKTARTLPCEDEGLILSITTFDGKSESKPFLFQGYYMMAAMHIGICLLLGVLVWLFLKGTKKLREKTAVR